VWGQQRHPAPYSDPRLAFLTVAGIKPNLHTGNKRRLSWPMRSDRFAVCLQLLYNDFHCIKSEYQPCSHGVDWGSATQICSFPKKNLINAILTAIIYDMWWCAQRRKQLPTTSAPKSAPPPRKKSWLATCLLISLVVAYVAVCRPHVVLTVGVIMLPGDSGDGYYANQEDDFIFEDFARLRLKGYSMDDTEAWPPPRWLHWPARPSNLSARLQLHHIFVFY